MERSMALELYKAILAANDNVRQKMPNEVKSINPFCNVFENNSVKKKLFKIPYIPTVDPQRRRKHSTKGNEISHSTSDYDSVLSQKPGSRVQPTRVINSGRQQSTDSELQISYSNKTAMKNIILIASKESKQRPNSTLYREKPDDPKWIDSMRSTQTTNKKALADILRNESIKRSESPFRGTLRHAPPLLPPLQNKANENKPRESNDKLEFMTIGIEQFKREEDETNKMALTRANSSPRDHTNLNLEAPKATLPTVQIVHRKNSAPNEAKNASIPSSPSIRSRSPSIQPTRILNRTPEGRIVIKRVENVKLQEQSMNQKQTDGANKAPKVTAKSWALFSSDKGFLVGKKENKAREIASLTKIMTCYICLKVSESLGLSVAEEQIKISKVASSMIGTSANLTAGDRVRLIDLLHGLMLPSGNDAAFALAEHFGRLIFRSSAECKEKSEEQGIPLDKVKCNKPVKYFVREMNRIAREMMLSDTNYANPHGLPHKLNISTAKDQGELSLKALKDKTIREIVNTQKYVATILDKAKEAKEYVWENTNVLLQKGYDGVKTGTTVTAGACLVSSLTKQEKTILCVILRSDTTDCRWSDAAQLTEYALEL